MSQPKSNIVVVSGSSLKSQPWWPQLHSTIIEAFLNKNHSVYPPTWTRLNPDPEKAAEGLGKELGDSGLLAVTFSKEGTPVACGGALPHRGNNWINEVDSKTDAELANSWHSSEGGSSAPQIKQIPDWEICCFCVHPSQRGRGYSHQLLDALVALTKPKGARRLFANYAIDETGDFWPRLGFEVIPGAGGMLPKGFKVDPDKEGLRADVHFKMGVKTL